MTSTIGRPGASGTWTAAGPDDAPAIVFIHGTRLTRAQWSPQLGRLSRTYRCIAIDLPAHGARSGEPFSLDAAAAAVVEAIETAVPARRAVVVGLSLGGYVAIEVAERYPERVAGLVLAGCSAEPLGITAHLMRSMAWILEHAPSAVLDVLNMAFFRVRYGPALSGPIVEGGFWYAGGARAVRALLGRRFLERLGRLWTPVLVVNGALDPIFGPGGETWAAACRDGRSVVIPWAGHLASLDRPVTFATHVGTFVRSVADAA